MSDQTEVETEAQADLASELRTVLLDGATESRRERLVRADAIVCGLLSQDYFWASGVLEKSTTTDLAVVAVRCAERARRTWLEYAQAPTSTQVADGARAFSDELSLILHPHSAPQRPNATGAVRFAHDYVGKLRDPRMPSPIEEIARMIQTTDRPLDFAIHATATLAALLELVGHLHGRTRIQVARENAALVLGPLSAKEAG